MTACVGLACAGHAQTVPGLDSRSMDGRDIILPQRRVLPAVMNSSRISGSLALEKVDARVLVNGRNAQTSLTLTVKNGGKFPSEAELLLPVPEGSVIKGFYYGDGKAKWQASLMPAAEARRLYDSIVARRLDPALLEFAGFCAIRSSVFPVPAGATVTLGVVYEQLLSPENDRLDYVLPRSEALSGGAQWSIRVELAPRGEERPCNVLAPSHAMEQNTLRDGTVALTLNEPKMSPGSFRLSWRENSAKKGEAVAGPDVSVYATPDAGNEKNGYFLIMLGKNGPASGSKNMVRMQNQFDPSVLSDWLKNMNREAIAVRVSLPSCEGQLKESMQNVKAYISHAVNASTNMEEVYRQDIKDYENNLMRNEQVKKQFNEAMEDYSESERAKKMKEIWGSNFFYLSDALRRHVDGQFLMYDERLEKMKERLGTDCFHLSSGKTEDTVVNLIIPREVTLVLDRSGSMRGEKLEKMKEAAKQIISGLKDGECFNLIAYNEGVDSFAASSVRKEAGTEKAAHEWLDSLTARGGTNIHEALKTALLQPPYQIPPRPYPGEFVQPLPVVLFLTDGQPTIGITSEKDIVALAEHGNGMKKRIFTVGVGTDLNAPLLRKVAEVSGGLPAYIQEGDRLDVKMARVFRQLSGPLFTNMRYEVCDMRGGKAPNRVQDVMPARVLPDLFDGMPVVVAGRYTGTEPFVVKCIWTGRDGKETTTSIVVDPGHISTVKDDFVARLWAARKIGELETALMDMGSDPARVEELRRDPKTKELVEEMMQLSRDFGIMSSAASFFADDGSSRFEGGPGLRPLPVMNGMSRSALGRLMSEERSGAGAVALQQNAMQKKMELSVNKFNTQKDALGRIVSFDHSAQIARNSYVNRNGLWQENTVTAENPVADRTVRVGTPEYAAVADSLIRTNRQGLLALDGSVLFRLDGKLMLMQNSLP